MKRLSKIVLVLSLTVLFLAGYIQPTSELYTDLGGHLLRGQVFVQTHRIPSTNLFSYTYPDFSYINLEWLTETIFYLVNSILGINSLILLTAILSLFSIAILYRYASKKTGMVLTSYIAVPYILVLYYRANVLPEVFSYFFLSLFILLLYKFRDTYTPFIWFLIPLQLLWVNMHIYFILGILVVGLFLTEAVIKLREKDEGKYIKKLIILFAATSIVSLVNPYGISGLLYPFVFGQNYAFPGIIENSSIFHPAAVLLRFVPIPILIYIALSVFIILAMVLQFKRLRLVDVFILIVFIVGALLANRVVGLFVFATFIPFTLITGSLIETYGQGVKKKLYEIIPQYRLLLTILLAIVTIALLLLIVPQIGKPGLGITSGNKGGVDFFINNELRGPILNNYDIGSYLGYRLYPKEKVFVDSRPEAYPASFFQQVYLPMMKSVPEFQRTDTKYNFNTIIYGYRNGLPADITFLRNVIQNKDWTAVYIDGTTIIFVKNVPPNENIIKKFAMSDKTFRLLGDTTIDSLRNLVYFLKLIGWKNAVLVTNQKIASIDPDNCRALYDLITQLGPRNPASATYLDSFYINRCKK
jgi:hypothetical protein